MSITRFPHGVSSFGVPITGSSEYGVPLGKIWFVDTTNGSDGNSGLDPTQAFATIQKAITTQIAQTSGLGDIIYIAPGNYAEILTGNLTNVSLIGCNAGHPWQAVMVYPGTTSAYTGDMSGTMFKNMTFMSAASGAPTLPAIHLGNMRYSIIEDCNISGQSATCITGIQIGPETDVATAANFDYSIVRRNHIGTWAGVASEFAYGIKMGTAGGTTGDGNHVCVGTKIENNDIFALTTGILLNVAVDTAYHTVIRGNVIDSAATANGCATTGITVENSAKVMIVDNRINATDAILAGSAERTLANLVTNAGTAAGELPVYSV